MTSSVAAPHTSPLSAFVILSLLKAATADDHRRTEALMPSLDELASPSGYAWAMRALHGFHRAWEPALFRELEPLAEALSLPERRKLPLLEADLRALRLEPGVTPPPPAWTNAPRMAAALGALYVLEGSTLGGRMIARRCGPALGLTRDTGMAFFEGHGERTGAMWKAFGAVAEAGADTPEARDAMLAGARGCFAAMASHLASLPPLARAGRVDAAHG